MEATVKQLRARGNEEFAKGNFEEACKLYSQCAETITGNTGSKELKQELVLALSNKAQASLKLGDFPTALRDTDAALEYDEFHVKSTFRKARALHGLGEHDAAVGCLQKLLLINLKEEVPKLQQEALKLLPPARAQVAHFHHQMFLAMAEGFNLEVNPKCLGSSLGGQPLLVPLCANGRCRKRAEAVVCGRCSLVSYCRVECKGQHHREHVKLCGKLRPSTSAQKALEKTSLGDHDLSSIFLWGNVPGISLIAPTPGQQNTGSDLNLCFAASGDLRDVIITMNNLPMGYSGKVRVLVNDFNAQVAVRNYLILELLRRYGRDAVECAIALWYSDAMSEEQKKASVAAGWDALKRCGYLERSASTVAACGVLSVQHGPPLEASFKGGMSSLWADLDDMSWSVLYGYLNQDLQPEDVTKARLDRCMRALKSCLGLVPESLQPAWWQFHVQSGLMLPFSSVTKEGHGFSAANKFLLDPQQREWSQNAVADPLHGWSFKDIESAVREFGLPRQDWYGGLFFHLRKMLVRFVDVVEKTKVEIKLFCRDAGLLADQLKKAGAAATFDAIATSNIADSNYLGMERVLTDWGPLLASNGTLVTMQMNWAFPQEQLVDQQKKCVYDERYRRSLLKAFGVPAGTNAGLLVKAALEKRDVSITSEAPEVCIGWCRRSDVTYNKHLEREGAHQVAARVGLEARPKHKLVPARIAVPLDAPPEAAPVEHFSCAEELRFNAFRRQPFLERYVEWTTKA